MTLKEDGTPDSSKIDINKNIQALRQAASIGLVEPKLTIDEVAQMKFGIPEYIGTKVLEISGVTSEEEAKKKRSEIEDFAKSPEGLELATLCLDYSYHLAENPRDLTRDQINFLVASLELRLKRISYQRPQEKGATRIVFE